MILFKTDGMSLGESPLDLSLIEFSCGFRHFSIPENPQQRTRDEDIRCEQSLHINLLGSDQGSAIVNNDHKKKCFIKSPSLAPTQANHCRPKSHNKFLSTARHPNYF